MDTDKQEPAGVPAEIEIERIYGRDIRKGTLEQFAKQYGFRLERDGDGRLKQPAPKLGIEKFKDHSGKFYRLIWLFQGKAWLAAENVTPYRTKVRTVAAGAELAARLGCTFDEATR